MKTHNKKWAHMCLMALAGINGTAMSAIINNPGSVPVGQTLTVTPQDTLSVDAQSNGNMMFTITGTLVNQGLVNAMSANDNYDVSDMYVGGLLDNSGNLFAAGALSILGGNGGANKRKIVNQPSGSIILSGYVDMYSYASVFENAGTVNVVQALGHNVGSYGFTAGLLRGTLKNTGTFSLNRSNSENNCYNSNNPFTVINEGLFEVGKDSFCKFNTSPIQAPNYTGTVYRQTQGATVVNGTLGAHVFDFQGGVLGGTGTVLSFPEQLWSTGFSIAPGTATAPTGTLSITPEVGYSVFGDGSLDFVMGGVNNNNSQLHVNGDIYIVGSAHINVSLKNGFVPSLGNSFTLVTADYVGTDDFNQANLNLPKLPGNLHWQLDNDGTHLKVTVY